MGCFELALCHQESGVDDQANTSGGYSSHVISNDSATTHARFCQRCLTFSPYMAGAMGL